MFAPKTAAAVGRFQGRNVLDPDGIVSPLTRVVPRYVARNLISACEPSQKGLFFDAPQRHSVMRLRTS